MVSNLALNARDAMPIGGLLTIETANVDLDEEYATTHMPIEPGHYASLIVTDTGVGMTPEVQARLFEPFFTTKELGNGTGLGLSIVHGIVARSGGRVNVYSELGVGTTFKAYFRSAEGDPAVEAPSGPRDVHDAAATTVLVVEDREALRVLIRRLLERKGYTVIVVASAAEAVREFEQNATIDLVLTDVVMPGGSGPELVQELVKLRADLRVVYMSGHTEDAIIQRGALQSGVVFLQKPFTSSALEHKLREALGK